VLQGERKVSNLILFIKKIERNEIAINSAKPSFFIRVGKYWLPAIFPGQKWI
jgi:hypothetical protein